MGLRQPTQETPRATLLAAAGKKTAASRGAPGGTLAIARLGRCPRMFVDSFAFFEF